MTQLTETIVAEIRVSDLKTEKQLFDQMNIQMHILDENVTNVHQGSTLEVSLQQFMYMYDAFLLLLPLQCKEAISENSKQREEQEKRMREMFAEFSLNGECRKLYIILYCRLSLIRSPLGPCSLAGIARWLYFGK